MTSAAASLPTWSRPARRDRSRVVTGTLVAVAGALAVFYVIELNSLSRRGFEVRAFEQRIQNLQQEQQKLSLRLAELQSMTRMEERVQSLGLVPADQVQYLKIGGAPVARR